MSQASPPTRGRPKVGISACLLGQRTRFDGEHKLDRYVAEELGSRLEWIVLCPEVELGLGVPRETMHLVGDPKAPRLLTTGSRRDLTEEMLALAVRRVDEIARLGACGFILKRGSPSCGPALVPVLGTAGSAPAGTPPGPAGIGLFARAVAERFPGLPCCDEQMLGDPVEAGRFLERVWAVWRRSA